MCTRSQLEETEYVLCWKGQCLEGEDSGEAREEVPFGTSREAPAFGTGAGGRGGGGLASVICDVSLVVGKVAKFPEMLRIGKGDFQEISRL